MVAATGGGGLLVGITHECDIPPGAPPLARGDRGRPSRDDTPGAVDGTPSARSRARGQRCSRSTRIVFAHWSCGSPDHPGTVRGCAVRETDVRALASTPPHLRPSSRSARRRSTGLLADLGGVGAAIGSEPEGLAAAAALRQRCSRVHDRLRLGRPATPVSGPLVEWLRPVLTQPALGPRHGAPRGRTRTSSPPRGSIQRSPRPAAIAAGWTPR